MVKEFDQSKLKSIQSKNRLNPKIEVLENMLEYQKSEAEDAHNKIKKGKAELKLLRDKLMTHKNEVSSQTDYHPDVPYLVHYSNVQLSTLLQITANSLSIKIPTNTESILWCPLMMITPRQLKSPLQLTAPYN